MLYVNQFAWQRYFAKIIDLALGSILLMLTTIICCAFFIPTEALEKMQYIDKNIDRIVTMFFTCILVIPLMHNLFGTTIGKKIWGIKVYDSKGNHLNFKRSLDREI